MHEQSKPVTRALQRYDTLHICESAGARISCLKGELWITQEGDVRDIIIGPGQTFVLDRRGLTLVQAVRASVVATEGAVKRASGHCLEASARRLRLAMLRGLLEWLRGHVLPMRHSRLPVSYGAREIPRRGSGGAMGYQGVPHSVAIEFDTYLNTNIDLSSNHVAVDTGGNLSGLASANPYGNGSCGFANGLPVQNPNTALGCMSNGDVWNVRISYDGSLLDVVVQDGANPEQNIIKDFPINIAAELGTDTAFIGFTAGTAGGFENHDILNWRFANTVELAQVPEPASLALVCLGLTGIGLRRRKQVYPR